MTDKQRNFLQFLFKKRNKHRIVSQNEIINEDNTLLDYYLSFVQNHPDIILILSLDGKVVSHNKDNINQFLGYVPQDLDFKELVSEENYAILQSAFYKATQGTTERVNIDVFNKHGEQLFFIATFIPLETTDKLIEGVFLILNDVTEEKRLEVSYKLNASHLKQAQQIANTGSWEYLISTDKMTYSPSCFDIFGFETSENLSIEIPLSYIHPEDHDRTEQLINRALTEGVGFTTEFRINHGKTNELRYIKVKVEVFKKDRQPIKLVGVVHDHTEEKQLEVELKETNNTYQYIFDHIHAGIWMRESIHGKITFASEGLKELLQIPLATLYEEPDIWKEMILPMYREELFEKYKLLMKGESIEHQYRIKDGSGVTKWIYEQTIPRVSESGEVTHVFGMVTDITYEIGLQKKLEFLAKHDALTALPNYLSLHKKLDELIKNDTINAFAYLSMDLDNFNWINDYLGHRIGDIVLQRIASRLISILPQNGYLAKMNNDAFIFILQNYKNKNDISQFAEQVIEKMKEKVTVKGYEFHVTASIGVSFYPENGETKLKIMENAHTSLYHAKHLGKNNYQIYSFDRDISSHKRYVLEKDLRKAIKNEEFELYYQPQVNPKSGAIESAEALIRWNHKEWGLVSPGEFIPLAEEKHLIHHIGEWVIRNVCLQLQSWREKEYPPLYPIAINISPICFLKHRIVKVIKRELENHQIPAKYLEIEITERSLLQNEKIVFDNLYALRELGVKIALDDFGTGYSSLHYLQKFELDTLKIDRMFIQKLDSENKKDAAIVASVLHLAKGLDMTTIAEGVEEHEQLEFLKQKECDIIQGYLYSRPVPADKFEQMIQTRYLQPKKKKRFIKPEKERRMYFRFVFPSHLPAKMNIIEVNQKKVNIGSATILVENISLGGIRLLSPLRLPVNSDMKLNFHMELMNTTFDLTGSLVYKNEEKREIYSYGVSFEITEGEKDNLAEVINKMTVFKKMNNEIPNTVFIEKDPYLYLTENS